MTQNSNVGHGHVFPRPDGMKARCGGPALCTECARDQARKNQGPDPLDMPASPDQRLNAYVRVFLNAEAFADIKAHAERAALEMGVTADQWEKQRSGAHVPGPLADIAVIFDVLLKAHGYGEIR